MNKICIFFLLVFIVFALPADNGIFFSDLNLSQDNRLLFKAGLLNQDALFLTALPERGVTSGQTGINPSLRMLSVFPEKMDLLDNGQILQIRNAFGVLRLPLSGGLPAPVPGITSFEGGTLAGMGRAGEVLSSPDGRRILYINAVSPALGDLVMLDLQTGVKTLVSSKLDRPETTFPASWSPDSRFFLYERDGKLFFYMAGSSLMPGEEKLRLVGDGRINSIVWGRGGDFYYLRGSTLYQVRGPELFARTLYADFLAIGTVAGNIPFEFDPAFDNFWLAPNARSVVVSKGRRSLHFLPLGADAVAETVLSYLVLPRTCSGVNVFWPADGSPTAFVSIRENGGPRVNAWRLSANAVFEPLTSPTALGNFPQADISPDGKLILFWGEGGIILYDFVKWELSGVISENPGISCLWEGNDRFITGDDHKIERVKLNRNAGRTVVTGRELLCLSAVTQAGFEENSARILARNGDEWFLTDGRHQWTSISSPRPRPPSQVSAQYRVYLENQGSGAYQNIPMVRNITSVGTFSLLPVRLDSGVPGSSRAGRIALCFDLYDDDWGLLETLDALKRFGVKATFFLNGEFIRRHPLAAAEIAAAGHEVASMFFALVDLSDIRYRTDSDFITRGLARNEDEFFRVTGKELSLLWHPPWYTASPYITTSAARAGYTTVMRDIDPMDWVSLGEEKTLGLSQRTPSEMVDYILRNCKPNSVIPIRLGLLPGGRNGYLFDRINVLLDALLREGYTLTTVSALNLK